MIKQRLAHEVHVSKSRTCTYRVLVPVGCSWWPACCCLLTSQRKACCCVTGLSRRAVRWSCPGRSNRQLEAGPRRLPPGPSQRRLGRVLGRSCCCRERARVASLPRSSVRCLGKNREEHTRTHLSFQPKISLQFSTKHEETWAMEASTQKLTDPTSRFEKASRIQDKILNFKEFRNPNARTSWGKSSKSKRLT